MKLDDLRSIDQLRDFLEGTQAVGCTLTMIVLLAVIVYDLGRQILRPTVFIVEHR